MAPAKNHLPYFRVYVGDEERTFRRVGVAAEGLYSKLRRVAHDADPTGLLIDHARIPYPTEDLADLVHLRPGDFRANFRELRERQIIQTIGEFRAGLREAARGNRRKQAMVAIFENLVATIGTAETEPMLIPSLVSQHLESLAGRNYNDTAKSQVVAFAVGGEGDVHPPVGRGGTTPPSYPPVPPGGSTQGTDGGEEPPSHSHSQKKLKKKTSTTRAGEAFELRQQPAVAPWSWEKHLFLSDEVRKLDVELKRTHPEALDDERTYASHFFGRLKIELAVYQAAQEYWQHGPKSPPVPLPCLDGHHVPDSVTGRCTYCNGSGWIFQEESQ
jgi:hypothetical protein